MSKSLQETYAPNGICFGCGPANAKGLRIRSFADGDGLVATWKASPEHAAFPGMLSGGITGTLLDCHSNWTAAWQLMRSQGLDEPPCTVTASYSVQLRRPIPLDETLHLRSRVVETGSDRVQVEATLEAGGKVCATCTGTFVAVKPGHPAYHRWG